MTDLLFTVGTEAIADQLVTSGTVAKLCKVAPRTAAKWMDAGFLKTHRLPGCRHRRTSLEDVVGFILKHKFPMPAELKAIAAKMTGGGE